MLVETRTRAPRNQASSVRGAVSTRTPASFDLEFWTIRSFATLASLRFIFRAMVAPRVCTSTHAAHAHRTTWRRFSTSATVRTHSRTGGARVSLGTRPQRRSTETLLDPFSFSSHTARPHLTTSPRPVPRAAAKVYVATEAAIGMGLGLVAGAAWKVRPRSAKSEP